MDINRAKTIARDIVLKYGNEILTENRKFRGLALDKLPDMKKERNLLISAVDSDVGRMLLNADILDKDEKCRAIQKVADKMRNELTTSDDGIIFVVLVISDALGWSIPQSRIENLIQKKAPPKQPYTTQASAPNNSSGTQPSASAKGKGAVKKSGKASKLFTSMRSKLILAGSIVAVTAIIIVVGLNSTHNADSGNELTSSGNEEVSVASAETESAVKETPPPEPEPEPEVPVVIHFDANGGSLVEGATDVKTVIYGQKFGDLPSAELPGYEFVGWFSSPEGGVPIESADLVDIAEEQSTVFAHYEAIVRTQSMTNIEPFATGESAALEIPEESISDNAGNTYTDALVGRGNNWNEYIINEEYTTFSAKLALSFDDRTTSSEQVLIVSGNNQDLYVSPIISNGFEPLDINVDVTGVKILHIETRSISGDERVILGSPTLSYDSSIATASGITENRVWLEDIDYFNASQDNGGLEPLYSQYVFDNTNNLHLHGLHGRDFPRIFNEKKNEYVSEACWNEYKVKGEYSSIEGKFGLDYDQRDNTENVVVLKIYGDGKLLYTSSKIKKGVEPKKFKVDINGVKTLRLAILPTKYGDDNGSEFVLMDTYLVKI